MKTELPLAIENVTIHIGGKPLLQNLNLQLQPRQFISLMGENGIGKTCLLETIGGIRKPAQGKILFWGEQMSSHPRQDFYNKVGWVTSTPESYPWGTRVCELFDLMKLIYPRWNQNLALEFGDQFKLSPTKRLADLSLGEQSKVRLLKAISFEPKLLLLDELTANLSPPSKDAVLSVIIDLFSRLEMSILYVCHTQEEAMRLSDRIYELTATAILEKRS